MKTYNKKEVRGKLNKFMGFLKSGVDYQNILILVFYQLLYVITLPVKEAANFIIIVTQTYFNVILVVVHLISLNF